MNKKNNRLYFISFVFIVFGAAFLGRVIYIQLFFQEKLLGVAGKQYQKKIRVQSRRGSILDRNGEKLAVSIKAYSVFADPKIIKNKKAFSNLMARHLRISSKHLLSKIRNNKTKRFIWIRRQIDRTVLEKIKKSSLSSMRGWGVIPEYRRKYFENGLAANLLGYVSTEGKGLDGIEYFFNKSLSGDEIEWRRLEKDAKGRSIFSNDESLYSRQKFGKNLQLSLSRPLQALVEHELREVVKTHQAKGAAALVMDPRSGEIFAWAESPSFNPERYFQYAQKQRTNHLLTDPIEPGSVIKPFVIAGALEKGLYSDRSKIKIPGAKLRIKNKVFRDVSVLKREVFSLEDILVHSSNIGVITVQQKLGSLLMRQLYQSLGFQQRVMGLPGESNGVLRWYSDSRKLEYATLSFGQGFSITPLQLIRAFSVFARGDGTMVQPRIVLSKNSLLPEKMSAQKVFSKKTVRQVNQYLREVVKKGTGRNASLVGVEVAGKTGTTQKLEEKDGVRVYSQENYRASFIGYFPQKAPRFLVYTMVDAAQKEGHSGSLAAAPLFKRIAKHALWVSPDKSEKSLDSIKKEFHRIKNVQTDKVLAR